MVFNIADKYTWIKGDNFGKEDIVRLPNMRKGSMGFVEFVSGRRCNLSLAREFLSLVSTAEESEIENPEEFIRDLTGDEDFTDVKLPGDAKTPTDSQGSGNLKKPVSFSYAGLLEMIKDTDEIEMPVNITLQLPRVDAIKVLIEVYGDDFKSELETYLLNKILTDELKEQTTEIIKKWISNLENK